MKVKKPNSTNDAIARVSINIALGNEFINSLNVAAYFKTRRFFANIVSAEVIYNDKSIKTIKPSKSKAKFKAFDLDAEYKVVCDYLETRKADKEVSEALANLYHSWGTVSLFYTIANLQKCLALDKWDAGSTSNLVALINHRGKLSNALSYYEKAIMYGKDVTVHLDYASSLKGALMQLPIAGEFVALGIKHYKSGKFGSSAISLKAAAARCKCMLENILQCQDIRGNNNLGNNIIVRFEQALLCEAHLSTTDACNLAVQTYKEKHACLQELDKKSINEKKIRIAVASQQKMLKLAKDNLSKAKQLQPNIKRYYGSMVRRIDKISGSHSLLLQILLPENLQKTTYIFVDNPPKHPLKQDLRVNKQALQNFNAMRNTRHLAYALRELQVNHSDSKNYYELQHLALETIDRKSVV